MFVVVWLLSVALAGGPALVTTVKGGAQLGAAAAPPAPFVLVEGQTLQLAAGAEVVVLYQGSATRVVGPQAVNHAALDRIVASPAAGAAAVDGLLARKTTDHRAAASRAGGPMLLRPVPAGAVTRLREIRVRCTDCTSVAVVVHDLLAGADVWTATVNTQPAGAAREGTVAYAGPPLAPSTYFLRVGAVDFPFEVVSAEPFAAANEALSKATVGLSAAEAASVPAAAWWSAGLVGEAVYAIDAAVQRDPKDAALAALLADYESRLGLAAPR